MLGHHQVRAIRRLVSDLISGCSVSYGLKEVAEPLPKQGYTTTTGEYAFTRVVSDTVAEFCVTHESDNKSQSFTFERSQIPFTKAEKSIFFALPDMCRSLTIEKENNTIYTQQSISSQFGMPYLLIAHFMRGSNPSCLDSSITPLYLLQ